MRRVAKEFLRFAATSFAHADALKDGDRGSIGVEGFGPDLLLAQTVEAVRETGEGSACAKSLTPSLSAADDETKFASQLVLAVQVDVADDLPLLDDSEPQELSGWLLDQRVPELEVFIIR